MRGLLQKSALKITVGLREKWIIFTSLDLEMTRLAFGLNVWGEREGMVSKMSGLSKWRWGRKEQAWVEGVGKAGGTHILFWTCKV